jgi:2-oxoisovalerate dehydrogenase E1 component
MYQVIQQHKLKELYASMIRIRYFEDGLIQIAPKNEGYPVMTRGTEAVAAGVCATMAPDDYLLSTHKSTGHLIARGSRLDRMMAEIFAKGTGSAKGKGGRMALADLDLNIIGGTGVVGANIPISCGVGLTCLVSHPERITVCFFGDGATSTGAFHEGMGLAASWNLPIVFVIENNQYGAYLPISEQTKLQQLSDMAASYGLPGLTVDGNDAVAVAEATMEAVNRARGGGGPTLIEAVTYVVGGGTMTAGGKSWRTEEEVEFWKQRDPIDMLRTRLHELGVDQSELDVLEAQVAAEIADAVAFTLNSPAPSIEDTFDDIYHVSAERSSTNRAASSLPIIDGDVSRFITYEDAIREALHEEMSVDDNVLIIGEHVTIPAVERSKRGLIEEFGAARVRYTPIAEMAIVGAALGGALTGLRPVAEIATINFTPCCMDQIVNHVAKYRYATARGDIELPIVIRTSSGNSGVAEGLGVHHEQSLEALFTQIPGLTVVTPSTPYDAKGLLKASIEGGDPVLFIEHRQLYGTKGYVPNEPYLVPLGKAAIAREGTDITIVAWSNAVLQSLEAAARLDPEGISAEVIDLRTLIPLDLETVLTSVRKTGRFMVVHEACKTGGFGGELAALVAESCFPDLVAPVRRVASKDSPIPVSREQMAQIIMNVDDIVDEAIDLMNAVQQVRSFAAPVNR